MFRKRTSGGEDIFAVLSYVLCVIAVRSECCVEQGDAVDLDVEVGSGAVLGFIEHAVFHDFVIGGVSGIEVNVCHVRDKVTVFIDLCVHVLLVGDRNGELGTVEDVKGARFELRLEGGETTGIGSVGSTDGKFAVTVTADGLLLTGVTGAVKVYTTDGRLAGEALAEGGSCRVALSAGLYLVKAGGQTVKVRVD